MKKQGQYCKVCGEYKAHEKFSGRGHAAHICKKCAALSAEERNQRVVLNRLMNLPWQMSKEQVAWLKALRKDSRPEVSALANELYQERFPFAERNERKKQLYLTHVELRVCGEMNDEYGDGYLLEAAFSVDKRSNTIQLRQENEKETVQLQPREMTRLMRWMIRDLEIFCWDEDYDLLGMDDAEEAEPPFYAENELDEADTDFPEEIEPVWELTLTYRGGATQTMVSYSLIHDRLNQLIDELLSYFASGDSDEEE